MNAAALKARARVWWRKDIRPLLVLALVLFSIRSSLADWNDVPSGSMRPTIIEGDRVFVNKLAYDFKFPFTTLHLLQWANPQRGDIVVFYSPYDGKRLVKRVVGLPGDTLELRHNRLFLNGVAVEYEPVPTEPSRDLSLGDHATRIYRTEDLPGRPHPIAATPSNPARRDFGPFRVPNGQYFMMGDNRDDSFDSRYYGPVSRKQILGRALAVVFSFDRDHFWIPRWKRSFHSLG